MTETDLDHQEFQESLAALWRRWRWSILGFSCLFFVAVATWMWWQAADERVALAHSQIYEEAHTAWLKGDRQKAVANYTSLLPTKGYGALSQLQLQALEKPKNTPLSPQRDLKETKKSAVIPDPLAWPCFLGYGYQVLALGEALPEAYLDVLNALKVESPWFAAAWELRLWNALIQHQNLKPLMALMSSLPANSGYVIRAKALMRAAGLSLSPLETSPNT